MWSNTIKADIEPSFDPYVYDVPGLTTHRYIGFYGPSCRSCTYQRCCCVLKEESAQPILNECCPSI